MDVTFAEFESAEVALVEELDLVEDRGWLDDAD